MNAKEVISRTCKETFRVYCVRVDCSDFVGFRTISASSSVLDRVPLISFTEEILDNSCAELGYQYSVE